MPQEFMVLKCFNCAMFQVHQVRKASTWLCKICSMKQSQRKVYGKGSGKECRFQVQSLNMKKAEEGNRVDDVSGPSGMAEGMATTSCLTSEKRKSKWEAFKTSSNVQDEVSDVSDEELDAEMSEYDFVCVRTAATLVGNRPSRYKRRRVSSAGADLPQNSKEHDNPAPAQRFDKENIHYPDVSRAHGTTMMKRDHITRPHKSTHVSTLKRKVPVKVTSKWGGFAAGIESSSSDDD